ncbi:MAG: AmmeMemoRadiSam system radical SAM enzyme [Bacillota bacterium]|nr:AmmeMemoRadiSam system radical SAM enzyme [Bacillota bacterium]
MKEASFYSKKDDNVVKCELCPNKCIIKNNCFGICRVRKNIDGILYAIAYGEISGYNLDPIEKKPIKNYKQGSFIFSVGSYGCNFKCKFCQNYEIAHGNPNTLYFSPKDLIDKAKKYKNSIGIAYTYNEPIVNFEYILDCAKLAKKEGFDNVLVTNGYICEKPFKELLQYVDAVNIDLKAYNDKFYLDICEGKLDSVKKSILIAAEITHVEITTMLIDELNTDKNELISMFKWISEIDKTIPMHLTRYFPRYKMTNPQTKISTMLEAFSIASRYLKNVYLGNI